MTGLLLVSFLKITKNTNELFSDFREENISIKSVDSLSVLRKSDRPGSSPLLPTLNTAL
jgi:hypothetical protein